MEALIDEVDFMYGKQDGKVRVKTHDYKSSYWRTASSRIAKMC